MPGDPAANAQWNTWRDFWLGNWGWTKVLAEPSMFWIQLPSGVARMEVDNDNFLVTAPTQADLDTLARPLQAWDIKVQILTYDNALETALPATSHPLPVPTVPPPVEQSTSF